MCARASWVLPDVDGNGSTDIFDFILLNRYLTDLVSADNCHLEKSNCNGDYSIDIADALLIKLYVLGINFDFPYHPVIQVPPADNLTGTLSSDSSMQKTSVILLRLLLIRIPVTRKSEPIT